MTSPASHIRRSKRPTAPAEQVLPALPPVAASYAMQSLFRGF